jgi:predicted HicB family RNase H-like nuclease
LRRLTNTVINDIISAVSVSSEKRRPTGRPPAGGSGRMTVRLSKALHRDLAAEAVRQGRSLNALVCEYLARGVGWPEDRKDQAQSD